MGGHQSCECIMSSNPNGLFSVSEGINNYLPMIYWNINSLQGAGGLPHDMAITSQKYINIKY